MSRCEGSYGAYGRLGAPDCALALELRKVPYPYLSTPVAATLRYHRVDPFAVYLDSHVDLPQPVTWVFARALLDEGTRTHAGAGNVSVHPATGADPDALFISLSAGTATVKLRTPAGPVRDFLAAVARIVPAGSESGQFDLDEEIRRLLYGTPPPGLRRRPDRPSG